MYSAIFVLKKRITLTQVKELKIITLLLKKDASEISNLFEKTIAQVIENSITYISDCQLSTLTFFFNYDLNLDTRLSEIYILIELF